MKNKYAFVAVLALMVLSLALVACGGGGGSAPSGGDTVAEAPEATTAPAGDAAAGKTQFDTVCIACHGPGGVGVEGLGKPFTTSEFLLTVDDQ